MIYEHPVGLNYVENSFRKETFDNIWFNNNILIYNLITFNYMH